MSSYSFFLIIRHIALTLYHTLIHFVLFSLLSMIVTLERN
ncbi:hypothetical protein SaSA9_0164 [Streptococcus agalactiae]|nr:hypothetical protein SaSA30_0164 [Streptococcus agalactiae]AUO81391.1 hypothetical protein SaSA33_0164 [Streptococcus agalactiae]AUO86273.1 hypothetical protein SaSA1_0164 [Streptococcus agalactiae]AUO87931.1 hypothetical protein SaSA5_0164 [Streptococcus agalactiae]AUO89585.1 hypothetical protein SaSA9_0164 [Streptococcus agalactiae]